MVNSVQFLIIFIDDPHVQVDQFKSCRDTNNNVIYVSGSNA